MIAGKPYAFVSMERVGGLMVFNISNPASPQFVQYVNNRGLTGLTGDRGPEGIIYVTQPNSPTGKAYIVLGNEVSSSVSVYEIACPSSTASVTSLTTTACEGETLSVTTNTLSGATYTWYNSVMAVSGATTSVYNATTTGSYSVKLDNVGCVIPSNTVSLTFNALPSVSATTSNTLLCSGQSATLTATSSATSYTWSDGATTITTVVSPTVTTDYTITVNDGLCGSSAVITQSVNTCTGLTSNDNNNVLRVYPNPFIHSFKVNWNADLMLNKEVSIYVYNVLGELVYTEKTNDTEISINTKDWKNGSYFIKVNNTVSKIVKQD